MVSFKRLELFVVKKFKVSVSFNLSPPVETPTTTRYSHWQDGQKFKVKV